MHIDKFNHRPSYVRRSSHSAVSTSSAAYDKPHLLDNLPSIADEMAQRDADVAHPGTHLTDNLIREAEQQLQHAEQQSTLKYLRDG